MSRTLLIIPAADAVDDYFARAQQVGASEIAVGVPPYLADELAGRMLPTVWTEEAAGSPSTPSPEPVTPAPPTSSGPSMEWAAQVQAQLDAQQQILDLLLLGGLDDSGGTLDAEISSELPDSGGTLDDLDLAPLEG